MTGAAALIAVAFFVRLAGSSLRSSELLLLRLPGWFLATAATWVATSGLGVWAPLWIPGLVGLAGALLDHRGGYRPLLWLTGDAITVVACWLHGRHFPGLSPLVVAAVPVAGSALDLLVRSLPRWARAVAALAPVLCWSALSAWAPGQIRELRDFSTYVGHHLGPQLAIVPVWESQRIALPTGAVAWLYGPDDRADGRASLPGALLFHGADPRGAHQPAALFLRRALLHAGFVVLSVDHPGYGGSGPPIAPSEVAAWNPLPTSRAAVRLLRSIPGVAPELLLVGHSMGATQALRLLAAERGLAGAFLFGAARTPGPEDQGGLYHRFHTDRRLEVQVPRDVVREIERRYYDTDRAASSLPAEHPPIVFGRFEEDFENIVATRDELYAMIPGKALSWTVAASHYFDSHALAGLFLGDAARMRSLTDGFRRFLSSLHPEDGERLDFQAR